MTRDDFDIRKDFVIRRAGEGEWKGAEGDIRMRIAGEDRIRREDIYVSGAYERHLVLGMVPRNHRVSTIASNMASVEDWKAAIADREQPRGDENLEG